MGNVKCEQACVIGTVVQLINEYFKQTIFDLLVGVELPRVNCESPLQTCHW